MVYSAAILPEVCRKPIGQSIGDGSFSRRRRRTGRDVSLRGLTNVEARELLSPRNAGALSKSSLSISKKKKVRDGVAYDTN